MLFLPRVTKKSTQYCAQGGINAAKNYKSDGDSVMRLFYDTIKGETLDPEKKMYID